MIENGKTILLILLVCSSLLQSYLLANHSTDFESILESRYVETEIIGTQEEQEDLVFPQQIVLHEDTGIHSVLYPEHYFYQMIMDDLQDHKFEGIRVSDKSTILLKQMMNQQGGVEIKFPNNFPLQIIRNAIPLDFGLISETEWIRTMWITRSEEQVEIYLVGDNYSDAYEVLRTDLNADKIKEYINFGEYQTPKYLVSTFGYLYPAEAVPIQRITQEYGNIGSDKMENMLFPDPGITRNLPTSDGMEIYSDGKRGLEIDRSELWMSYTDPMAPLENTFSAGEDLNTAVQFVNQHGGWNGKFELEQVALGASQSEPRFVFRQYVSSFPSAYPVLNQSEGRFGQIGVVLQRDVVTEYERSLILPDPAKVTKSETFLQGGEGLMKRIDRLGLSAQIEMITPAYKTKLTTRAIEFIPVWAVVLNNGTIMELP